MRRQVQLHQQTDWAKQGSFAEHFVLMEPCPPQHKGECVVWQVAHLEQLLEDHLQRRPSEGHTVRVGVGFAGGSPRECP